MTITHSKEMWMLRLLNVRLKDEVVLINLCWVIWNITNSCCKCKLRDYIFKLIFWFFNDERFFHLFLNHWMIRFWVLFLSRFTFIKRVENLSCIWNFVISQLFVLNFMIFLNKVVDLRFRLLQHCFMIWRQSSTCKVRLNRILRASWLIMFWVFALFWVINSDSWCSFHE